MSIPDRIILTLYTMLMAVVAVFLVLFSLGVISTISISTFAATVPGRWEYAVGGVVLLLVSLRLLIAGLGGTGGSNLSIGNEKYRINKGFLYIAITHSVILPLKKVKSFRLYSLFIIFMI